MKRLRFLSASATLFVAIASAQTELNQTPSRVVGQPSLNFRSQNPNVVQGREFFQPWSVAVDRSSTPSPLYVSDFGNNRVLAWRDSRSFANGSQADLVIGQLDNLSTTPLGPGTSRERGLSSPGALAVDSRGALYVVDTANNRILRFPKPFESQDEVKIPDMVLGQPGFGSELPNQGGLPSERTVALSSGTTVGRSGLAFDPQGNLWFSDPLNHRVLRFPVAALNAGMNGPSADVVLGQPNFTSAVNPPTAATQRVNKAVLRSPAGLAVDADGRLYVGDDFSRVLVYTPPYNNGKEAARLLGVAVIPPNTPPTNDTNVFSPEGVFIIDNRPGVVDAAAHRILIFDPFASWAPETAAQPSPPAKVVIGQGDFLTSRSNRGLPEPNNATLSTPLAASANGNELFVADAGNNRVLAYSQALTSPAATRVLGQVNFNLNAPNMVEGNELFLFTGFGPGTNFSGEGSDGGGIAVDSRPNFPPRLYISDTFNNRILAYRDARRVRPGDRADLVIGQSDFLHTLINAPQGDREVRFNSGLFRPSGLAVDRNGDLFVADSGNGRILRFPSPFERTIAPGERHTANLVLGQQDFSTRVLDPSNRTMAYPFGLALTVEGGLVASDPVHNRILFFRRPNGADFTNGMAAERVISQSDFFTVSRAGTQRRLANPRHIAVDTDDRLYVADTVNNRVVIYDRVTTASNDPEPAFFITGVTSPQGIYVSPLTGEIWVTSTRANPSRALRFRRFQLLALNSTPDFQIGSGGPLALTQDGFGNLYIAEASNRVAIHYSALAQQVAGNFADRPLSPGAIGIVYPRGAGVTFSSEVREFTALPLPREINDTQVLINDQPVPLYFVAPGQINFLVPMSTPDNGTAELQVLRPSTGQILAAGTVLLARVSPALFIQGAGDQGQIAALNEDNTVNTPATPALRGSVVQIFGTGQGFVPNAPPDGTAPSGPLEAEVRPDIVLNTEFVKAEDILYSGLAPSLVGVWQINFRISPTSAVINGQNDVAVILRSVLSNRGFGNKVLRTSISIRL